MKKNKVTTLVFQVTMIFVIGVMLTGVITYYTQSSFSDTSVKLQMEGLASAISSDVMSSIQECSNYRWLMNYLYAHHDELAVQYDDAYNEGSGTEEKCRELTGRHPDLQIRYADIETIEALPAEDRRLYAEISYSWIQGRLNQIKQAFNIDYLFVVLTDEACKSQFFLFSAAEPGASRGTHYEDVYPLGMSVTVSADQQEAMQNAIIQTNQMTHAGNYEDYYTYFGKIENRNLFIGMTYNMSGIRENVGSRTFSGTIIAMLYQVMLSLICLALIVRFVVHPLNKVKGGIRLYKQTKDSKLIRINLDQIRPYNEIGQLSQDVMDLTVEMDQYEENIRRITAEKERVNTELNMAARIQESMLPNHFPAFPDRSEFDVYAVMDPAREVGGDFYDFFLVDDDHLCLVMADVSGKGIPAALFMMASKIILANNAKMGRSPAQILTDANAAICSNNKAEMFVTVWLGILEISTGKLTAANAGHEYPVLMQPNGSFELYKDRHGFVVGGLSGVRYREYSLQLEPGAKLFIYTDGVPEATDANNELFGTERMLAALNTCPEADPLGVLRNMRMAVDDFVKNAEQFDDLTMLCLEYKGPKADGHEQIPGAE